MTNDTPSTRAPPARRPTWAELMPRYRDAHRQLGTRVSHMFGIPMIVAALPVAPWHPIVAGALFVGGWICQLVGHAAFERNKPQFVGDWRNLLVGVAWSGIEWAHLLGRILRRPAHDDPRA